MQLKDIAYARSGDKGSDANIALMAYRAEDFPRLVELVTEEAILHHFSLLPIKEVRRYELPKLWALNFVLRGVLEGGGSLSLKSDNQGKALGVALLEMEL